MLPFKPLLERVLHQNFLRLKLLFAILMVLLSSSACLSFQDNKVESFESCQPGEFQKLDTEIGIWNQLNGTIRVDDKHAKTGKQCLQLAGGKQSSVELVVADEVQTDGQLKFWAERWTSRSPFSFRIEKESEGKWTEIYNGDKTIRVGRPFLSHLKIALNDSSITKLRFTTTSPPNTGILLDDISFAPAKPQKVASVEVIPLALPALKGLKLSALAKLKITTTGTLDPKSLANIDFSVLGRDSDVDVAKSQILISGNASNFRLNDARPLDEKQTLLEGDNYFWIVTSIKPSADIDNTIGAKINSVTFSDGTTRTLDSKPTVQKLGVALRKAGDNGVHTYRIPGLATTNKGTLIGVYDVRHDGGGDLPGNIDVGMSRSTDGGQSWEQMQVIMDMGSDPKWRGDGIGDPSILVDRKTGTIWVSATWSHGNRSWNGSGPGLLPEQTGQWMMVKSSDDGLTWSEPINITSQIKKPEWSFILQGPGKGITISDGTLVFPAQYQDPPNKVDSKANRLPHSSLIYSPDQGVTWKVGTGAWDDTTEAQIVELSDNGLMLNCRTNRSSKRAVMITTNLGSTWKQHPTHLSSLVEPRACMASLINVGRELGWRDIAGFDNNFLLFSNPDSLNGRNHITIKASKDSGMNWPAKHQLLLDEQPGRGYSCLSMIDSETVGILYEGSQSDMTFQRIKITDILSPPANQKTKNSNTSQLEFRPAVRKAQSSEPTLPVFARPFTDYAVLQCDQPIRIWGHAKPESELRVTLGEKSLSTSADKTGKWIVEFPEVSANFDSTTIVAANQFGKSEIKDVLIGEVWFCAGQSNMEWPLKNSKFGKDAIVNAGDNFLRVHNCSGGPRGGSGIYSKEQLSRLWPDDFSQGQWQVDSAESAASFSAVGYYFAKKLREKLNRPVGVINVSIGGTPIESWINKDLVLQHNELSQMYAGSWLENLMLDEWCKERGSSNLKRVLSGELTAPGDKFGPNHSFKPGFMYEAGIKPFGGLSIRGGLWYQGESNADNPARTRIYDACFPLLVEDWRQNFNNKTLSIAFVQLPAMGRPNWPVFREYQRRSLAKLNNVGMATTIDTGNKNDVHPRNKKPVGERLAQWALVNTYQKPGIATGPLLQSTSKVGDKIIVSFNYCGDGLKTRDGQPPNHFEVAGEDNVFYPATATIRGSTIELTSDKTAQPTQARYAWKDFPSPVPNLVNSADLPASPFTTEKNVPSSF